MEDQGSFLRFCEKVVSHHNTGNMRPSSFCLAQAIFGGQDIEDVRGERLDREMAAKLLEVIEEGEKLFPEIVEKYSDFLDEAKSCWKGIVNKR